VPSRNEKDLEEVPKDVLAELKIHLVKRVSEVLPLVLEPPTAAPASTSTPPPATTPDGP
jgi:ATP-dependent Lon protease